MSTIKIHLGPDGYSLKDDGWIAECLSLDPKMTLRIPHISTSWDCLCVLYLLAHLESHYWITDNIHRQIAQKAYIGNYEGEWKTVQEILEQYPQTPKEFFECWIHTGHSAEEFFGNLVRRSRRLARGVGLKKRDPHGPIVYPQYHRGYRDKGTLRPSHRPAVLPAGPEGEKIDKRKDIGHPLLHDSA